MSKKTNVALEVLAGIVLIAVIDIVIVVLSILLLGPAAQIFPSITRSYGITYFMAVYGGLSFYQLLYVVPLNIFLRRKGKKKVADGITIGAVITALLCGGCFFMFFRPF
ncbi:MAG: hypothetical protein ACFB0D_25370 [Phormidesmis sp.]